MLRFPWSVERRLAACLFLGMAVAGCSSDALLGLPTISADSAATLEADEPGSDGVFSLLPLPTADGYDQTVHPDYAMMPGWSPRRFLVATPYAFSLTSLENPSLYAQPPGGDWTPHGHNPLVTSGSGYLSDPDMVAVEDLNELWIYYREANDRNTILLIRSLDGLHWSDPKKVASAPKHMIVSPSVVRLSRHDWRMWSVNARKEGCRAASTYVELRRSTDGINWSLPVRVSLSQSGGSPWHIEVQWIPSRNQFWALYNLKRAGNCNTDALYLATSTDGKSWRTYRSPLLRSGVIPAFADIVYRSTFAYNPKTDNIRFWFSGARRDSTGYVWHTVYQKRSRADVFGSLLLSPPPSVSSRHGRDAPLLVNPP